MEEKILNFINAELKRLLKIETRVPDTIDDDSWWDGEDCYMDGHRDGEYFAYITIKKMLEEVDK